MVTSCSNHTASLGFDFPNETQINRYEVDADIEAEKARKNKLRPPTP